MMHARAARAGAAACACARCARVCSNPAVNSPAGPTCKNRRRLNARRIAAQDE